VWALFPDKYEGGDTAASRSGVFTTTLVAFFFAEIGDKTQIATVALAARFEVFYFVVLGTTLGMTVGSVLGMLSAYLRGRFDSALSFFMYCGLADSRIGYATAALTQ